MQQVGMLRSMHQTTQQQLTQAQQMLHEMQHRYDRLLEAPRQASIAAPETRMPAMHEAPRGARRQRITALLQQHPDGLTPAEIRDLLGADGNLADTCQGMLRYGLVRRVGRGKYVAAAPSRNER
jgi:hypothetical protein